MDLAGLAEDFPPEQEIAEVLERFRSLGTGRGRRREGLGQGMAAGAKEEDEGRPWWGEL